MSSRFEGIRAKIFRAEELLSEVRDANNEFRSVKCSLDITKNDLSKHSHFQINLPPVPFDIPLIVGDCLNNLRSSLDHLIWQLVDSNTLATPTRTNMFPICDDEKQFTKQCSSGRLNGVPPSAIEEIRKLQPYEHFENRLLNILNELCNKDKHRELNYAVSVASDIELTFCRNGVCVLNLVVGNDELRNGEIFGDIAFPTDLIRGTNIEIFGTANAAIAFKDFAPNNGEALFVVSALEEITEFIKYEVIDRLSDYVL